MKRCGEIELFRFIFAVIIMLRHAEYLLGENICFPGGAFGVEFFFLVSGYLMMSSLERIKNQPIYSLGDETASFIKRKCTAIYPEVLISMGIAFIVQCFAKDLKFTEVIKLACNSFFEVILLSHSGLGQAPLNSAIWYLSTMLLVMLFIFPLIRKYHDAMTKIIMPLIAVFILGYLVKAHGGFRNPSKWINFVHKGFLRGIAEICLGAELYFAVEKVSHFRFSSLGKIFLTITKWLCWVGVILYMTKTTSKYDSFFLALLCTSIVLSFSKKCIDSGFYQNEVVFFLGRFSLPLYLNHRYLSSYLSAFIPSSAKLPEKMSIYIVASILTALFVMLLSSEYRKHSLRIRNILVKLFIDNKIEVR